MISRVPRSSCGGQNRAQWIADRRRFDELAALHAAFLNERDIDKARDIGHQINRLQDALGLTRPSLGAARGPDDD